MGNGISGEVDKSMEVTGNVMNKLGLPRPAAITEGKRLKTSVRPPGSKKAAPEDLPFIQDCFANVLFFGQLDAALQARIAEDMYERRVPAGEILIQEGDAGSAASELYIVKEGEFEVLERRQGVNFRVNMKKRGDVFGEVSLMYNVPRTATVAATQASLVWVLERDLYRHDVRDQQEREVNEVATFLNSVPLLASLTREEKLRLLDGLEERTFLPQERIITQGEAGEHFYIIKGGEAVVYQETEEGVRKVNYLFKADFFGEKALLSDEPRGATVEAVKPLTCLCLARERFVELLGPLEALMSREKSVQVVTQRLMKLETPGSPVQLPAEVIIRRRKRIRTATGGSTDTWEMVRARGHLDEVEELRAAASTTSEGMASVTLTEGQVLGGGAFSRVSIVTEESTGRQYALKRMRKSAVVECPEHVFCEQTITRNTTHPFCIRQYGSFQDKYHLYFLFDLMAGGDLMDVLVAEAKVIKRRVPENSWRPACFAPKVKMLKGMEEDLARFYIGSVVLALDYLHTNNIVYRDLKPENVFIDEQGYAKLGDFGFAKVLESASRTYTFCGTPGYVAPENVLARGYNFSVDWWGLGVLMYVLLTGRQPFSSPRTDDPMVVMRRIVDDNWNIKYQPYLSVAAKDLIARLLERKPGRRLGMLSGRGGDIKRHKWFEGLDWDALANHRLEAPRKPADDSAKRLQELTESERKQKREIRETPEELRECELVFSDF